MTTVFHDLERDGVAVLRDALDLETVSAARVQLDDVARAERDAGTAMLEDGRYRSGVNQRVFSLLGKGNVFWRFATAPKVLAIAREILGDQVILPSGVVATMDPELRELLGCRPWHAHGLTETTYALRLEK